MIRRRGRSRSGTRRKSRWEGGLAGRSLLGGAPGTVPTVAFSSEVDAVWMRVPAGAFDTVNNVFVEDDCTVYRTIHSASFQFSATATGALDVTLGMGLIQWDGISDTPPAITDIPFPVQNGSADWLWWWVSPAISGSIAPGAFGSTLATYNLNAPEAFTMTKAQRKLSTNKGLLLVAEVFANVNGLAWSFGWNYNGRYALKLP